MAYSSSESVSFAGLSLILTCSTATRPSMAFAPSTGTELLWLMPMLVFCRSPDTYSTDVSYVQPSCDDVPEYFAPALRLRVSMALPLMFPTITSLAEHDGKDLERAEWIAVHTVQGYSHLARYHGPLLTSEQGSNSSVPTAPTFGRLLVRCCHKYRGAASGSEQNRGMWSRQRTYWPVPRFASNTENGFHPGHFPCTRQALGLQSYNA